MFNLILFIQILKIQYSRDYLVRSHILPSIITIYSHDQYASLNFTICIEFKKHKATHVDLSNSLKYIVLMELIIVALNLWFHFN